MIKTLGTFLLGAALIFTAIEHSYAAETFNVRTLGAKGDGRFLRRQRSAYLR